MNLKIRNFLLGIVVGLMSFPLLRDIIVITDDYWPNNKIITNIYMKSLAPSYGLSDVLTQRCTKDVSKNGLGWVFVRRDFFNCGKVAVFVSDLIFGEYTEPVTKQKLEELKKFKEKSNESED